MAKSVLTLYQAAGAAMQVEIKRYLSLIKETGGFANSIPDDLVLDEDDACLLGAGLGIFNSGNPPSRKQIILEMERKSAIPFDAETSITYGVYTRIRPYAAELFSSAEKMTNGWTLFRQEDIQENPYLLPVFQHVAGFFSKAALKNEVGAVSDRLISEPAAKRLSELLTKRVQPKDIRREQILSRIESTLEGIVRDLVGRVLLEEVVASALRECRVPFLREAEYPFLSGVVYDFRADFVIPDCANPAAFIEVRKSSSRHAALYAKDKMFSAINWKGKHKDLIGALVVEGDWTGTTLRTVANIFDYVIPLAKVDYLAQILKRAFDGDKTILKWLIDFQIKESPDFSG